MSVEADKSRDLLMFLVRTIRKAWAGMPEREAVPIATDIVRELKREYGDRVYIPNVPVDRDAVVAAVEAGASREEVCRAFRISRATFYRLIKDEDTAA